MIEGDRAPCTQKVFLCRVELPGNTPEPLFSLSIIPGHPWTFLFGLPDVKAVGTSALLMSPYLFYLLSVRRWELTHKLVTANVAAVLLAVLAFRSTGFEQVGYRSRSTSCR